MEMYFRSVKNIRDLGGIMTQDGHRIKEKMLIRSSALDALSPYEFDILKNEYNLNLVIDFRTTKSFVNKPDLVGNIRREHLITYKFLETQQFTHDIGCECDDFFLKVYRGITLSEESKEELPTAEEANKQEEFFQEEIFEEDSIIYRNEEKEIMLD